MGLFADLKIISKMVFHRSHGDDHKTRLDNFYGVQADDYDDFRKRLLPGREQLWNELVDNGAANGVVWYDMGGGTGSNLQYFGDNIAQMERVYVVDLASTLLNVADRRIREQGWENAKVIEADATTFLPEEKQVDVVTFSYSLTMIPDWFAAIDHAYEILKPGGRIGVVDFYVSRKYPSENHKRHGWTKRTFWPAWFSRDNVFPSPDHVPYLHRKFDVGYFYEGLTKIPYFPNPFFKMPYYIFIGKKPSE
ncbi:MAG: class I SAM-dependent methyltransferase [Planctomycetaceae bacterium]|jgi:S-adenosylmethionine-diacylgycerolhomoserine-N-methlytransferase|nr:class I SAM-dependent methyltransferase [Planctomycetaceae bacterium]